MNLFILRFILFSGLLYGLYSLIFSHFSFFKINRVVLISIPAVALLIPFIAPHFQAPQIVEQSFSFALEEINIATKQLIVEKESNRINWWSFIYILGVALVLIYVLFGLLKGWGILKQSNHAFDNVYTSNKTEGPFALFNRIIVPIDLLKDTKLKTIIAHENAHVNQLHGVDNLYYNILSALCWFNPFIHLLYKELRQTHEYLADEEALHTTPKENYAHLLLSKSFGTELHFDSANRFFNSSLIKTRITMMYKAKTNQKMRMLYLLILPFLSSMVFISCENSGQDIQASDVDKAEQEATINFAEADTPPLFPNCDPNASKEEQLDCFQYGIMKHVQENFKYPEKAMKLGLQGKLYAQFTIKDNGAIDDVTIARGLVAETEEQIEAANEANNDAISLIKDLPSLAPAVLSGENVPVQFILPISMVLPNEGEE